MFTSMGGSEEVSSAGASFKWGEPVVSVIILVSIDTLFVKLEII